MIEPFNPHFKNKPKIFIKQSDSGINPLKRLIKSYHSQKTLKAY
ncbi:hypothetical protein ACQJ57_06455 [Helicobacter pylori]